MKNPFKKGSLNPEQLNYAQYLREQVSFMRVGDSKFIDLKGATPNKFRSTLHSTVTGFSFKTKADVSDCSGIWVLRIS